MIIDQNESYIYNTETPTYYDLNPGDVFYFINDKSKTVYMKLDKLCHWYYVDLATGKTFIFNDKTSEPVHIYDGPILKVTECIAR